MQNNIFSVKKIYTICFLTVMLAMGIVPIVSLFQNNISTKNEADSNTSSVSFSELYPFENEDENVVSIEQDSSSLLDKYKEYCLLITDRTNQYLTTNNKLSYPFKCLPSGVLDIMYGSVIENGTHSFIKLPNGYLAEYFEYTSFDESKSNYLNISTWLKEKDIPYLMLITPNKADDSITEFPSFTHNAYTRMMNEFKTFLNESETKYIDSTPVLLAENDDFYSWFYRTDHHWNVQAAFRMALETGTVLNDEMDIPVDTSALDESNYELTTYPNSFLGRYGEKLGYALKEDMGILYPNTETNFHIEIPGYGIDKTGCFKDTLIEQSILEENPCYCYNAFLGGNYPLVNIENLNCDNGIRILFIKYSFANPLCTYLANSVQYIDMIDPRYFDGNIQSYIEQTSPDVVIFCSGVVD